MYNFIVNSYSTIIALSEKNLNLTILKNVVLNFFFFTGTGRRQLQKKRSVADGMIDPDRDLYALPSQDGNEIYFLSLVDILTHYGTSDIKI